MKIRSLLTLVAMLSVLLFGIGTAHAVLGVNDDVPGTDVAFPFLCEKGGTFNTLWAVTNLGPVANSADLLVFDVNSNPIFDSLVEWTAQDVLPGDCQSLVAGMSPVQQAALEVTVLGTTFYAGYLTMVTPNVDFNVMITNIYLVDILKGFAAGFNGFDAEGFVTADLCEFDTVGAVPACVTASAFFPRYAIFNNDPNTYNRWIIWAGQNDAGRLLDGVICNEDEDCISLTIPIPDELNIIDVGSHVPAGLFTAFPHNGFGLFFIDYVDSVYGTYSLFGWSYQRDAVSASLPGLAVVHPMHRLY